MDDLFFGILLSFNNIEDSEEYFSRSSFPKKATMVQRAGNLEKYIAENKSLKSQLTEARKVIEFYGGPKCYSLHEFFIPKGVDDWDLIGGKLARQWLLDNKEEI